MAQYNIEAKVHTIVPNGGYRVKVAFPDMGMYINGVLVYPPNGEHDKWGVLTPRAGRGGRGKQPRIIEFNGKSELWQQFRETVIEAVKLHRDENAAKGYDDAPVKLEPIEISA